MRPNHISVPRCALLTVGGLQLTVRDLDATDGGGPWHQAVRHRVQPTRSTRAGHRDRNADPRDSAGCGASPRRRRRHHGERGHGKRGARLAGGAKATREPAGYPASASCRSRCWAGSCSRACRRGGDIAPRTRTRRADQRKRQFRHQRSSAASNPLKKCRTDTSTCRLGDRDLSLNSAGRDVTELQQRLQYLGFYQDGVDGNFGPVTESAVKAFQACARRAPNGVVGQATVAALNRASPASVAQCRPAATRLLLDLPARRPRRRPARHPPHPAPPEPPTCAEGGRGRAMVPCRKAG